MATASGGGNSVSYAYDYNGTRMQKTANGVTHFYLYSGSSLVKEYVDGNTLLFYYDQDGHPYALKVNGTLYYYITNLQGDVMGLVSASGTVVASYSYDPYGKLVSFSGSTIIVNAGAAGTTTVRLDQLNPLRYRGYYYDNDTNLYYLQSRYYDPELGRFINADVFTSTGQGLLGNNMFAYCGNNPIMHSDPNGESLIGAMIGGAFAGAAISTTSYVVGCGLTGQACTGKGMVKSAISGALSGALGGAIGTISITTNVALQIGSKVLKIGSGTLTNIVKAAASSAVGVATSLIGFDSSSQGHIAGVATISSTFLGSLIDTGGLGPAATAFANFATTLFVGTPVEIISVTAQQLTANTSTKSRRVPVAAVRAIEQLGLG